MKYFFLLFLSVSLFADSDITSFKVETRPKEHVEHYDFPGAYPQLEDIEIDATRKMRVSMDLSGQYPLLKKINYEGSFGALAGKLTGAFPSLEQINILCSSTSMKLDLTGKWEKNCTITIVEGRGEIELKIPKDVGVTVHTKVGMKGKVVNRSLEKMGKGILKKNYHNPSQQDNPIQLTLNVELGEGKIILN